MKWEERQVDVFLDFVFGFLYRILEGFSGLDDRAKNGTFSYRKGGNLAYVEGWTSMLQRLGGHLKETLGKMGNIVERMFLMQYFTHMGCSLSTEEGG